MKNLRQFALIAWISFQMVASGWLGIVVQDLSPQLAMRYGLRHQEGGAVVSRVQFGSPAMKGGLQEGDLIVSLSGEDIPDSETLKNILSRTPPGSRIALIVIRNRKESSLEIVLGTTPREAV